MDVGYRLCPETDLFGMTADVNRAITWMKQNAGQLGIDPGSIVLAGGSAGAHLALLAAYTNDAPEFRPADIGESDTSVAAVIDMYGPVDLRDYYRHEVEITADIDAVPDENSPFTRAMTWFTQLFLPGVKFISHKQMMKNLVCGQPDEVPLNYKIGSPVHHVSSKSPPTLMILGEDDGIAGAKATARLHGKLQAAGVPSVLIVFPWTDHAFDVAYGPVSQNSVASQAAIYEIDRFLYAATTGARAA